MARERIFDVASASYESQYLKRAKRLLADLVVAESGLDKRCVRESAISWNRERN
jgi:hypothetical protein